MKAVILAGGLGTRISEESHLRPKPMIEIGGKPILWHIMKIYSAAGINEFVICCGYKGDLIKEFFANYLLHMSDVTIDLSENQIEVHNSAAEPWKVTLVDTGEQTMTGGRLRRVRDYIDGTFCLTYGDGVSDIDMQALIAFHKKQGTAATVTAIQPKGRFGALEIDGSRVKSFIEKPSGDGRWISGGFFVCEPAVVDLIKSDDTVWEAGPMERLAGESQLSVYKHEGYWAAMDTMHDKNTLETLWRDKSAPWKIWP